MKCKNGHKYWIYCGMECIDNKITTVSHKYIRDNCYFHTNSSEIYKKICLDSNVKGVHLSIDLTKFFGNLVQIYITRLGVVKTGGHYPYSIQAKRRIEKNETIIDNKFIDNKYLDSWSPSKWVMFQQECKRNL